MQPLPHWQGHPAQEAQAVGQQCVAGAERGQRGARARGASDSSPVCFPSQLPSCRYLCWVLTRVGGSADKSSLFPLEAWILVSQGLLANLEVAQVLASAGTLA